VSPRRFEQRERAAQVGFEHGSRRQDAAVDVRLGREINDHIRFFFGYQRVHQRGIADIAADEAVT